MITWRFAPGTSLHVEVAKRNSDFLPVTIRSTRDVVSSTRWGKAEVSIVKGQRTAATIAIERQVPTEGYVACDTHVHTLTHSGHGDSTVLERMITIAGEGIELPIATDHNVQINHDPFARQMNVRQSLYSCHRK